MRGLIVGVCFFIPFVAQATVIQFYKNGFKRHHVEQLEMQLEKAVAQGQFEVTVELNSLGGDLSGLLGRTSLSQGLAHKIKSLKSAGLRLTTKVGFRAHCESACTALFALGDHRVASSSARFMFHPIRISRAGERAQEFRQVYNDRWLQVIKDIDPHLAHHLDSGNWFLRRRDDEWRVSGQKLYDGFGQFITELK